MAKFANNESLIPAM